MIEKCDEVGCCYYCQYEGYGPEHPVVKANRAVI
jgi:hypothetical protein